MVIGVFSPSCWLPLTPIHSTGGHHTPRIYGLRSYISVPVVLPEGTYFGNLCAMDARPASVSNSRTLAMLESFASLLAAQLATELATRGVHAALLHEREIANLREPIGALQGRTLPAWRRPKTCASACSESPYRLEVDWSMGPTANVTVSYDKDRGASRSLSGQSRPLPIGQPAPAVQL